VPRAERDDNWLWRGSYAHTVAQQEREHSPIGDVLDGLNRRLAALPPALEGRRAFLGTYARTTSAVGDAVVQGVFEDGPWVEAWDVAFAQYYLDALDAAAGDAEAGDAEADTPVPRPWRLAFAAAPDLHPLLHVLLGINAHINFDLPQALLDVISDDDFTDPDLMDRRRRDHERIDGILSSRVSAEDAELSAHSARRLVDRALRPANRWSSRRFLREARQKVWHNTVELQRARVEGPDVYAGRLGELEVLCAAKIADLIAPGQVLLRLAVAGFGVVLPPAR
jgi:hypothetical protein